jgi:AcrR family transcriptional regulator
MSPSSDAAPVATRGRPRSFDRDQALEQAMRLFWDKGYAGASMSDLTAAMGIASPSLYAAFGSKEGLYREAIDLYVRTYGGSLLSAMEAPTAREGVERLLRGAVDSFTSGDNPIGCMVMQTAAMAGDLSPDLSAGLCDIRAGNAASMVARLRRAIAEGEIAPGTDLQAVADFYATVHKGLSLSAKGGAPREELESVVTSAMKAWGPLTT